MKPLLFTLAAVAIGVGTTTSTAQQLPYVANVRLEGPIKLRGTLMNPLSVPLTAWAIDATDATGNPLVSETSDALLLPVAFVPPNGSVEVQIITGGAKVTTLAFRAGIDANGMEVGDSRVAFDLIDSRLRRAVALESVLDFLKALDPSTPGHVVSRDLTGLVSRRDAHVLDDLRRRAGSGSIAVWVNAAEEIRNQNQMGAIRHGVLRQRLTRDQ